MQRMKMHFPVFSFFAISIACIFSAPGHNTSEVKINETSKLKQKLDEHKNPKNSQRVREVSPMGGV